MNHVWRTEPNGDQSAVVFNLRLVIREGDRFSRWLLLGRSYDGSGSQEVPLESGCEDNVGSAKERAFERARKRKAALVSRQTVWPSSV